MRITIWRMIIIAVLLVGLSFEQIQADNFFKIQIAPVIDGKPVRPANYSIGKNRSQPFSHQITVSSTNFLKNITVGVQLFAWYNGGWIAKKNRVIQITDKRCITSQQDKILSRFLKYNNQKLNQFKEPVILNKTNVYISYDPESSLMVSQLEQPNFFIPSQNYIPIRHFSKEIQRINITIDFLVVNKSDAFIENKRRLGELIDLQNRVHQPFPIFSQPLSKDVIEPSQIWDSLRRNYYAFVGYQKKVNEKLALISKYSLSNVLVQDIKKNDLNQFLPYFQDLISRYKLVFKDSATPIWRWIFKQSQINDRIQVLQYAILQNQSLLIEKDILKEVIELNETKQKVKSVVSVLWITIDILTYMFSIYNIGFSRSYGTFLNIWIIFQIISVAFRIGFAIHVLAGIMFFLLGIILHWVICYFLQKRFEKAEHNGTNFDKFATLLMRNILIAVISVNLYLHMFHNSGITFDKIKAEGFGVLKRVEGDAFSNFVWSFSELIELLNEYYYFFVIIPQILLNFRFFNVEKATILRIALLFAIAYCQWPLQILDSHWIYKVLRLKQGILAIILTIQVLLFRKKQYLKILKPKQNVSHDQNSEQIKKQLKIEQASQIQLTQKNKRKAK